MKTTTLKITSLILLAMATLFTITWTGCKKEDLTNTANNQLTAKQIQQNAIAAIKAKYGNVSAGEVINVNKVANSLSYQSNGNSLTAFTNFSPPNDQCLYTCNNTNDPNNLNQTYTLTSISRLFVCESNGGSKLLVRWLVSVPYRPLSRLNSTTKSNATATITPFGGGSPITATTDTITITNIGADPSCSVDSLYQIDYTLEWYNNASFAAFGQITTSMNLYNNCSLVGNLVNTGTITTAIDRANYKAPCQRIDQVYVNPYTGPNNCATAIGNYAICTPPSGLVVIDKHQIEYRQVDAANNNFKWESQNSSIYLGKLTGTNTQSSTITPYGQTLNLESMLPSSGKWLVRYKNVLISTCNETPGTGSPWNTTPWTTELWAL